MAKDLLPDVPHYPGLSDDGIADVSALPSYPTAQELEKYHQSITNQAFDVGVRNRVMGLGSGHETPPPNEDRILSRIQGVSPDRANLIRQFPYLSDKELEFTPVYAPNLNAWRQVKNNQNAGVTAGSGLGGPRWGDVKTINALGRGRNEFETAVDAGLISVAEYNEAIYRHRGEEQRRSTGRGGIEELAAQQAVRDVYNAPADPTQANGGLGMTWDQSAQAAEKHSAGIPSAVNSGRIANVAPNADLGNGEPAASGVTSGTPQGTAQMEQSASLANNEALASTGGAPYSEVRPSLNKEKMEVETRAEPLAIDNPQLPAAAGAPRLPHEDIPVLAGGELGTGFVGVDQYGQSGDPSSGRLGQAFATVQE